MKILVAIDSLRRGGAERQTVELVKGLLQKEIQVVLCYFEESKENYAADLPRSGGLSLIHIRRKGRLDFSPVLELVRLIRREEPTIVHSVLNRSGVYCAIATRLLTVPHVCSVIREARDPSIKYALIRKMLVPFCEAYVANTKAGLRNRFKENRNNFVVIYNGFDLSRISISTERRNRGGGQQFRILMAASFSEYKDHTTLLHSVKELQIIDPELFARTVVMLAGDGPLLEAVKHLAQSLGIYTKVQFLGRVSDVEKYLEISDCAVLLSNTKLHGEGISNFLLEAMASRVPVLATRDDGTEELIVHEGNGYLVSAYSARQTAEFLSRIAIPSEELETVIDEAYRTVKEDFALDRYTEQYLKVYERLRAA